MNSFNSSGFRGSYPPRKDQSQDTHRINLRIQAKEVRVITDEGEQLGVMTTRDALVAAEQAGLDLVEVAPQAQPPVCKIMDYGKFKYKEQKKEAENRKKRVEQTTKELRLRYITDTGDLETKLKQATEFLNDGDKVKFTMRFKGREVAYVSIGMEKLELVKQRLADIAVVDDQSPPFGRIISITFAPAKKK